MTPPAAQISLVPEPLLASWVPGLAEPQRVVATPARPGRFWRRLAAFSGPGYLVAVGYMDPGNWATDIAGGSAYGYALLSVVLLSSLMAMLLQSLAAKLGVVTGLDLAQACRAEYSPPIRLALWLLCEVAIVACDLAEVIGTAIALQLLFGIPLLLGVCVTAADVMLVLALQQRGFRRLEAFVIALLAVIAACFAVQLVLAQPSLAGVAKGFVPSAAILSDRTMLYLAIGILGATVMPHNLYLHSSIVKARCTDTSPQGQREALRMSTIDSSVALSLAFFINAAILILSAATFHAKGQTGVGGIQEAYGLLSPAGGAGVASLLFGIALLASGQNSTVTGTLAGQIVMEGFLNLRMRPAARRLLTRSIAIVPAAAIAASSGTEGLAKLLVLSQVVLSLQLPFAIVPLVRFTGNSELMGEFANGPVLKAAAWGVAGAVIGLNLLLLRYLL